MGGGVKGSSYLEGFVICISLKTSCNLVEFVPSLPNTDLELFASSSQMFCVTVYLLRENKLLFHLVLLPNLFFSKGTICRGEDERCCSRQEDIWSAAEKC